jgi:transcriptional regulator with XRE-family HTH domain
MESTWYELTDAAIVSDMGQRLRQVRLTASLTQQNLAELTGLHRTTIRDIELGKPVNVLSLLAVFRGLGLLEALDTALPHPLRHPVSGSRQALRQRVKQTKKT